jgi:hypothetical protein
MNIETYLNIINIYEIDKINPNKIDIFTPLKNNKKLDAVSYTINIKSNLLKEYIDYIDIIENLNDDSVIEINNYKLEYKECFPILTLEDINITIKNGNCLLFKAYTLNSINKLEFNYYNKININNDHGLKIVNGKVDL